MESDFREMLLLTGLDHITEEELKRFKYLALTEFNIPRKTLNIADRTELADQLIQSAGAASAVAKAISIFQKLNYMDIAKALEEKKKEASEETDGGRTGGHQRRFTARFTSSHGAESYESL